MREWDRERDVGVVGEDREQGENERRAGELARAPKDLLVKKRLKDIWDAQGMLESPVARVVESSMRRSEGGQ